MLNLLKAAAVAAILCLNFPVYADFSSIETSEDSDVDIQELVKELSGIQNNAAETWKRGNHILNLLLQGDKDISEYDYLWTLYALIVNTSSEGNPNISDEDYLEITDTALNYLEYRVGDWVFTDIGQFRIEVYTQAANAAAWLLRDKQPRVALAYVEKALEQSGELYVVDTQVRILLNLDETDQAYSTVREVLAEYPDFGDFQDFPNNPDYLKWLEAN